MEEVMYHHVFTIGTLKSGESLYIYQRCFEEEGKAETFAETLGGTVFLRASTANEEEFRGQHVIGNNASSYSVQMYTRKSGWRSKNLSERPLI
jgi:hypothetical protein